MMTGAYVVYPSLLVWCHSGGVERVSARSESEGREGGGGSEDTASFSSSLSCQLSTKFLTGASLFKYLPLTPHYWRKHTLN